jgi:L-seryl-tRNA(Ser) seleniumtransferase
MGAGGMSGRSDPNWSGPNDGAGGGGAPRPAAAAGAAGAAGGGRGGRGGRGGGAPNSFGFSTWLLKDGEDRYIANRLVEIFQEAGVKPVAMSKPATTRAAASAKK